MRARLKSPEGSRWCFGCFVSLCLICRVVACFGLQAASRDPLGQPGSYSSQSQSSLQEMEPVGKRTHSKARSPTCSRRDNKTSKLYFINVFICCRHLTRTISVQKLHATFLFMKEDNGQFTRESSHCGPERFMSSTLGPYVAFRRLARHR